MSCDSDLLPMESIIMGLICVLQPVIRSRRSLRMLYTSFVVETVVSSLLALSCDRMLCAASC